MSRRIKAGRAAALALALAAVLGGLYCLSVLPHGTYVDADFGIETYHSAGDRDGDGIDDQADILQSVRDYLATEPKYRSKYYVGGYPDDEYGVCTDVVAFGLLGAGYDLRELVHEDVLAAPEAYGVEHPDQNIDFRRVRNLKVYFDRHATALTTDPQKIDQWQGGDVVVFEGHIGVVSEHRNRRGIACVLHNGSPLQLHYEEDILQRRGDIVGHYRIG